MNKIFIVCLLFLSILVFMFTGCGGGNNPNPSPTPTVTPASSPTPTPTNSPSPTPAGINLLANPGFETNDTWSYNTTYGERDTTSPHSGTYCLKFKIGSCWAEQTINSGFTPGDTITARYWGFLSAANGSAFIRLNVQCNLSAGGPTTFSVDSTTSATSYTKFEQSITIPANTTSIRVYITGANTGAETYVYADDIFVGYEN